MSSPQAQTVQRTSPIDTSLTMVELAAVVVRNTSIIPICRADSTLESVIFITLIPYTS
jgi:hypothetical protein